MLLALGVAAIVLVTLLSVLAVPHLRGSVAPHLHALTESVHGRRRPPVVSAQDPGRELRAEQRARALLRSCVNEEDWAMYSELGFIRVLGALDERPYAYLIYPHQPILAYAPADGEVLGEYCIEFPDHTRPYGSSRLPDSDDVLAKWIALTADERSLIEQANMHLPGRQIAAGKARRDLALLAQWERAIGGVSRSAHVDPGELSTRDADSLAAL